MNNSNQHVLSLPQLQGKSNYLEWKYRANLALRQMKLGKKQSSEELEVKSLSILVNSITDKIVGKIMHCATAESVMEKLDQIYGLKKDDIDELQDEFQSFTYNNSESLQENVSRLEGIRQKLYEVGEEVSDSSFRTRLLSSLPRRFDGIKSAIKLNSSIALDDLINALGSEDKDLQKKFDEKRNRSHVAKVAMIASHISNPGQSGSRKKWDQNQRKSDQSDQSSNKNAEETKDSITCNYCKEVGHIVKNCPTLEKRANTICYKCKGKGHFAKNCQLEQKKEKTTLACVGLTSLVNSNEIWIDRNAWILDSGCTGHICNDKRYFEKLEPVSAGILVGSDKVLDVNGRGTVRTDNGSCNLLFENVLLNENSPMNLISVYKLLKNGWKVKELSLTKFTLEKDLATITGILDKNNLWVVPINVISGISYDTCSVANLSLVRWHQRFAHQNFEYTKELLNRLEVKYESVPKDYKCVDCVKGKISEMPYRKSETVANEVGELTHSDLLTSPSLSLGGSKYALCLKDDFSRFRTVYFLKSKSETLECFRDYFERVKNLTGKNPRYLRSDNGTEEVNQEIDELLSSLGMIHQLTCPFSPPQNGRIERDMRTLSEAVTTVLTESKLKKSFWAEALSYVVYTLNRVSKSNVSDKTPYELFYNQGAYDVQSLREFGAKVIVKIPKEKRKKFDEKGEEGVFVGYQPGTKGYKVYLNSKNFTVSRNVVFLSKAQGVGESSEDVQEDEPIENTTSSEPIEDEGIEVMELDYDWESEGENDESVNAVGLFNLVVPNSFSDLDKLELEEKNLWKSAIERELDAMKKYSVWEAVNEIPPGTKPIDTMWVFRVKTDVNGNQAKARLVAKGCQIQDGKKSYYAPVASITSVRVFLAVSIRLKFHLKQLDVETAFLNGVLKEVVFIKVPEGYNEANVSYLRLLKALYGLPQSPRCWYDHLKEVLCKLGFRVSRVESCLFVLIKTNIVVLILAYVDDFFIAGNKIEEVNNVITRMQEHFTVKVMSNVSSFIGFHLNICDDAIDIDQTAYIEAIAKKYEVTNVKPTTTPMEQKLNLENKNGGSNSLCVLKFQKLLGAINYVMERTRPDVSYSTNKLSRYTLKATDELYKYLLRILKYLWTTKDMKLKMRYVSDVSPLEAYCDASWASESESKSTTGYVVKVYGNLVLFKSRKQKLVALSTAEAEYVALSECAKDVMWIRNLLIECGINVGVCVIFCDSQSAMKIAAAEGKCNRSRHISIKYHFIQDLVGKGFIKLEYVTSSRNLADFLTKATDSVVIKRSLRELSFV